MNLNRYLTATFVVAVLVYCNIILAAGDSVQVRVSTLDALGVYPSDSAPAEVLSLRDSRLAAQVSARVAETPVLTGETVASGHVLVILDCATIDVRLEQAIASAKEALARQALAKKQFDRALSLRKDGSVSEELFNERESNTLSTTQALGARRAAEQIARLDASHCLIKAPFSGTVAARLVDVGEWVNPGSAVVRLVSDSDIEVEAKLQQDQQRSIRSADDVSFQSGDDDYPVKLREIVRVIDRVARTLSARFTALEERPLPGAAGRIHWRSKQRHLPAEFLQSREGKLGVFVARDGVARFVALDDAISGHPTPIQLAPDTQIIIEGHLGLIDAQAINER